MRSERMGLCALRPVFAMLLPREQTHAGADTGIAALVKIEKALDARGKAIM